jgi:3-hydroxyacyl-CoA dehydrogenase
MAGLAANPFGVASYAILIVKGTVQEIRKVAVLGAGTMGSLIAAHLANAGVPCLLLDRVSGEERQEGKPGAAKQRNRLAAAGLAAALKARPPAFFTPECARLISTGNFEDDLAKVADCDWVIEAIVEDIGTKRSLLSRLQPCLSPETIVSSNTSGISLAAIAEGFDKDFRRRWLGTHFFNPPRYMKLLEIIPTRETLPSVVETVSQFGEEVLAKGVVLAKDRPNFIANRVGTFFTACVLRLMQEQGFSIEEIDALTGPVIGLPKSATFRTLDLVGLDVLAHVMANLRQSVSDDENAAMFELPEFAARMVERGLLGEKTRQGFYRKGAQEGEILSLDLDTFEYRPRVKPSLPALERAKSIEDVRERLRVLIASSDKAGHFYRPLMGRTLHYAASRVPEISDDVLSVDRAMKWGFNWEYGPFELWDALGIDRVQELWSHDELPVPSLIEKLRSSGRESFYTERDGKTAYFDFARADYLTIVEKPGVMVLAGLKAAGRVVKKNPGASLIDLGDGALCLEFHSKMNVIGPDAIQMIHAGLKAVEQNFEALVIGNDGLHFSAGANLILLLMAIEEGDWNEVHEAVRAFQNANMAIKYANKPVVVAPFGMALGGGTEISLHASRVVAAAETYMGLVEAGVGLIPAGGGTKEMLLRAMDAVPADGDPFPYLKDVFMNVGTAKVSSSAEEARKMGYLSARDVVSMRRDRQLALAKQTALSLAHAGYRPGIPREDIVVFGKAGFSKMQLALHLMRRAGAISDYDARVGAQLARVLSGGGEFTETQQVSEQYLLDLEREAFVSLCGEKKTVERIQHMLKTGKPLRN